MKREKSLEPLYGILKNDYIEKLRVIDPRVHNYSFYVKLRNSDVEKILKAYPNSKIEYNYLKKIKTISAFIKQGVHFKIFNITGLRRIIMIKNHDRKYKKEKEEARKTVF